ncbi:MAG: hypothetical protein ACKO3F_02375, partial [Cyanobium sp.]
MPSPHSMITASRKALLLGLCGAALQLSGATGGRAETCVFLNPIGGDGTSPIVAKTVGRSKLIGQTNWWTDFIVDRPYNTYK